MCHKPVSSYLGATLVETTLLIALIAVTVFVAVQWLGKNTRDALCRPIGGLEASTGQHNEVPKYGWNDQTQNCEPIVAGL
jgi:hypothetical protein